MTLLSAPCLTQITDITYSISHVLLMSSPCNHINNIITLQKMITPSWYPWIIIPVLLTPNLNYSIGLRVVGLRVAGLRVVGLRVIGFDVEGFVVGESLVGEFVMEKSMVGQSVVEESMVGESVVG